MNSDSVANSTFLLRINEDDFDWGYLDIALIELIIMSVIG